MKQTRLMMGMPITVEIISNEIISTKTIDSIFDYFTYIDNTFSVYKPDSEIMKINRGTLLLKDASNDMNEIFKLAEQTKEESSGYFDIVNRKGTFDPSGIVKGWAILNAAKIIKNAGCENFYVEAGGDIQIGGSNTQGKNWSIGIKNPFNQKEIIKIVHLKSEGIATSGTYIRGQHIYNPKIKNSAITDIVSLTVIGPNVYEADRFATAAFAMGKEGINFIEKLNDFEGYIIDKDGIATMTSGFDKFTVQG